MGATRVKDAGLISRFSAREQLLTYGAKGLSAPELLADALSCIAYADVEHFAVGNFTSLRRVTGLWGSY